MADHIEVGRRYPEITINTAYSFGLDDQEFVVSFEADEPGEFLDLVQELRGTESSAYTLRDTPIFTCVSMSRRQGARRARRHRRDRAAPTPALAAYYRSRARMSADWAAPSKPLRVAIVGSGPAGFYAAEHLLKHEDARRRGRHVRPPADPVRARPRRRRARPPEDQVGDPRLREDRRPARASASSATSRSASDVTRRRARASATTRSSTPTATATDRQLGIPGEDLPGIARGHRVRRLVQRPPRLRRPRVRPLAASASVVIGNGNVAADVARMLALTREELEEHRHRRPRDRGARRQRGRGDRRARPPRPGPGGVHQPRGPRARRDDRRRRRSSTRPRWSSTSSAARTSTPTTPTPPTARTSRSSPSSPSASPRASRKRIVLRFLRSPVEIQGDGKVERIVVGRNELYTRRVRRDPRPRHRRARDDRVRAGPALDRLQRASRSRASRSTSGRGVIPNEGGRVTDDERRRRSRASTPSAGSSAAPRGVIGTNKKDAQETVDEPARGRSTPASVPEPELAADRRRRSRSCSPSARPTTSPSRAGRRSTPPSSARGEPHGRPRVKFVPRRGDARGGSRQACRAGRSVADLARRGPADDRGGPARRRGRGRRRGRRRPPAGDRRPRPQFEGLSPDRPAPAGQERRSRRAWTTARSTRSRSRRRCPR